MTKKVIIESTINKIESRSWDSNISVARDMQGNLCALRRKDGEVRFVGYVHDYPQFVADVRNGVRLTCDRLDWQRGDEVVFADSLIADLKAARLAAGLTQQQVADKMSIAQQSLARLESCEHSPSIDIVRRYATALGLRIGIMDDK